MMASDRIRDRLRLLEVKGLQRDDRLHQWHIIIRLAQDEYDRELAELDSLNSVKADLTTEVPIVG